MRVRPIMMTVKSSMTELGRRIRRIIEKVDKRDSFLPMEASSLIANRF